MVCRATHHLYNLTLNKKQTTMRKIFILFAAMVFASSMSARVVTIKPSQLPVTNNARVEATIDSIDITISRGTVTSSEISVAQYEEIRFKSCDVFGYNKAYIRKIVFTCTANGSAKYGPGNFYIGEGLGYSFEENSNIGVWEGNLNEILFSAIPYEVRITSIEITTDREGDDPGQGGGDDPGEGDLITWEFTHNDYRVYADNTLNFNLYPREGWHFDDFGDLHRGEGDGVALFVNIPYTDLNDLTGVYSNDLSTVDLTSSGAIVVEGGKTKDITFTSATFIVNFTNNKTAYSISYLFKDTQGIEYVGEFANAALYSAGQGGGDDPGQGGGDDPGEGGDPVVTDPTNCAEAAAAALSVSADNEEYNGGKQYTIEGYVTSIKTPYSSQYNNISFWMADTKDGGEVLQAFRAACSSSDASPSVGDKVAVTGKLTKYNNTPEFAAGCTFVIKEKGEGGGTDPLPTEIGQVTTCAEAAEALAGVQPDVQVNNGADFTLRGYVTEIADQYSEQYGNISFWMADTKDGGNVLEAWRCKPESANELPEVGDLVEVTGKLKRHGSTPEFDQNCTCKIIEKAEGGDDPSHGSDDVPVVTEVYDVSYVLENSLELDHEGQIAVRGEITKIEVSGTSLSQNHTVSFFHVKDVNGGSGNFRFRICLSYKGAYFVSTDPAYDPESSERIFVNSVTDANDIEVKVGDVVVAWGSYAAEYNKDLSNCQLVEVSDDPGQGGDDTPTVEVHDVSYLVENYETFEEGDTLAVRGEVTDIVVSDLEMYEYHALSKIIIKDVNGTYDNFNLMKCLSINGAYFVSTDPAWDTEGYDEFYTNSATDANGIVVKVGDIIEAQGYHRKDFIRYLFGCQLLKISEKTAVETTKVAGAAVKSIENAMLIIERNGVRYNVMGQVVR